MRGRLGSWRGPDAPVAGHRGCCPDSDVDVDQIADDGVLIDGTGTVEPVEICQPAAAPGHRRGGASTPSRAVR
jgi:hypothetical protein